MGINDKKMTSEHSNFVSKCQNVMYVKISYIKLSIVAFSYVVLLNAIT